MKKHIRMLAILLLLALCMGACVPNESAIDELGLDENFGFSLPENGTMLFDSFVPLGFNFMDYAVVKYNDLSGFDSYEWTALSEQNIAELVITFDRHNEMLTLNNKQPLPEKYLPDYTKVKGIRLVDPPSKNGVVNKNKFAYVLLDTEKMYAYIVIYCP